MLDNHLMYVYVIFLNVSAKMKSPCRFPFYRFRFINVRWRTMIRFWSLVFFVVSIVLFIFLILKFINFNSNLYICDNRAQILLIVKCIPQNTQIPTLLWSFHAALIIILKMNVETSWKMSVNCEDILNLHP